jgi:hypothetical protein
LHRELGFDVVDLAERVGRASRLRRVTVQAGRAGA